MNVTETNGSKETFGSKSNGPIPHQAPLTAIGVFSRI